MSEVAVSLGEVAVSETEVGESEGEVGATVSESEVVDGVDEVGELGGGGMILLITLEI